MPPLRILILSDGRPGHFNLSEGIAAAAERVREARTERLQVRRGRWPGAVLAGLTRSGLPAGAMLSAVYGIDENAAPPSDLIISAGAETLAASVWLARARRCPNVFYGSLRLFDPHDFSLVLTSYARHATKPRHALALKPSRFDPDALAPLPHPVAEEPRHIGLLVGGDAGPIHFAASDWDALLRMVRDTGNDAGVRWQWHIANSRRTPIDVGDRLVEEASRNGTAIAEFLDVRTAGPGTLSTLIARCHAVLCTADSSSMISECVWSRKPTVSLAPAACTFTADERGYRDWLRKQGWCAELDIRSAGLKDIGMALNRVHPLTRNPLDDLAQILSDTLPILSSAPHDRNGHL